VKKLTDKPMKMTNKTSARVRKADGHWVVTTCFTWVYKSEADAIADLKMTVNGDDYIPEVISAFRKAKL